MTRAPAWILVLGVLILVNGVEAKGLSMQLEFDAKGQAEGPAVASGLQWGQLVFSASMEVIGQLDLPSRAHSTNRSYVVPEYYHPDLGHGLLPVPVPTSSAGPLEAISGQIRFSKAWSSLYVEADQIWIEAGSSRLGIDRADEGDLVPLLLPHQPIPKGTLRPESRTAPEGVAISQQNVSTSGPVSFVLRVEGLRLLEWHNATLQCSGRTCLDGGRDHRAEVTNFGFQAGGTVISFIETKSDGGSLDLAGTLVASVFGSRTANLEVDGWGRFPSASWAHECRKDCPADGSTLQVDGVFHLDGLQAAKEDRRIGSQFSGALVSARADESPLPNLVAPVAVGGAAIAAIAVAAKLVALLFSRLRSTKNERAQAILETILQQPGISFNQLKVTQGMGHGTIHYHLQRLTKSGLIVSQQYRNSTRYFENHGRYDSNWRQRAVLRKPEMTRLLDFLANHPNTHQAVVVNEAKSWGWSRSSTQARLDELCAASIVTSERLGKVRTYNVVVSSWP